MQQQSHQLLKECIQDRQEFERDMDLNVQQLMELKTCLETSVEILKGEVWALNAEIKKVLLYLNFLFFFLQRFAEQNLLKSNLEQVDNLVIKLRCDNDNLTSEVSEKNKELDKLKEQLEASEKLLKDENEVFKFKINFILFFLRLFLLLLNLKKLKLLNFKIY